MFGMDFSTIRPKIYSRFFLRFHFQVELWLEELHDRRIKVTAKFAARKKMIEKMRQDFGQLARLRNWEAMLETKTAKLTATKDLGLSANTADELLRENLKLQDEAAKISEVNFFVLD